MSMFFLGHPSEKDLALFAGGELGPLARWRIENHLQRCKACEEIVADFFHLQGEVSELAALPPVDWESLARRIGEKLPVSQGAYQPDAPRFIPSPVMWRLGLVTATLLCAFVVVRQLPFAGFSPAGEVAGEVAIATQPIERAEMPAEPPALAEDAESQVDERDAAVPASPPTAVDELRDARNASGRMETAPQPGTPFQEAPQAAPAEGVGAVSFAYRASRDTQVTTGSSGAVTEITAAATPPPPEPARLAKKAEQESLTAGLRRRAIAVEANEEAKADEKQPAPVGSSLSAPVLADAISPQPAPGERQRERAGETDKDSQAAQARNDVAVRANRVAAAVRGTAAAEEQGIASESAEEAGKELAQAAASGPSPSMKVGQELRGQQKTEVFKPDSPLKGFSVLPAALEDSSTEIGVAADGWISFRSLDERTGTITITDVYLQ
jgi:hypothetical protein